MALGRGVAGDGGVPHALGGVLTGDGWRPCGEKVSGMAENLNRLEFFEQEGYDALDAQRYSTAGRA